MEMPRVYLLPNLMTAGNLFCGFMAILQIIAGSLEQQAGGERWIQRYEMSLAYILFAFIFDMLDGRLARLGGRESAFGREFDSLADVVSFGLAPALLVLKIILADFPDNFRWVGGLVAFSYVLAGAMRLARFNLVSAQPQTAGHKDFVGFPIPAAAGLVASITLFMLTLYENDKEPGRWRYFLPVLLLFLSCMMYSRITYPSFKTIDWKAKRSIPQVLVTAFVIIILLMTWRYSLALVFVAYLIYGWIRPFISKRIREGIEEEEEDEAIEP
ncbi:MAG: CDP-diacylglycerol--serine O-phosphatidyltransferase [Verrucomicrobia bacterium]|nr:CDP-diacylglycerol--serine O-phosphatidyltransferase [Verrucomicrobiota bacterium]